MSASTRSGGVAGVLADRLLQGQTAINYLELDGPPSRRVMIHKRNSVVGGGRGGGQRGRGRRCRFFILYIFTFLFMRWKSNEAKEISNLSIIEHSNESRRSASNSNTKSFNFKYYITSEDTKY